MKKKVNTHSFKKQFSKNSGKTLKMNVAPKMYRGGIRL